MIRTGRIALWIAAWLSAFALLWLATRGVNWQVALATAHQARPVPLVTAVAANLGILALWAGLWRILLPRAVAVTYPRMFNIAAVTSTVMNTIPALVGHASAVLLLVNRGGVPARMAGTVLALDQVGEGLTKLAVLAVALAVTGLPSWMAGAATSVAVLVGILVLAVAAISRFGGKYIGDTRAGRLLRDVGADLQVVREPKRALSALAIALAMKGVEALAIASVIVATGIDLPLSSAAVVLGAVNLATMLPIAPGNIGTYEAAAVAVYRWMGVPPEAALAAAVLQHACFLLPAVGTGAVVLGLDAAFGVRQKRAKTSSRRS